MFPKVRKIRKSKEKSGRYFNSSGKKIKFLEMITKF